jgi:hypothetical protein
MIIYQEYPQDKTHLDKSIQLNCILLNLHDSMTSDIWKRLSVSFLILNYTEIKLESVQQSLWQILLS